MSRIPGEACIDTPPSSKGGGKIIGILCAVIAVFLFAGFTLASRLGFSSALTLPDMAVLRFGIAGVVLSPVFLKYRLSGLRWHQAAGLAFFGGLGFALFAYTGFFFAPASHGAVLLHGTLPLFTFAIVRLTSKEKVRLFQAIGLSMIGLGAAETGLFTAAVPCITTAFAIPLLSGMPSAAALVGVAIVTVGMAVAMRKA